MTTPEKEQKKNTETEAAAKAFTHSCSGNINLTVSFASSKAGSYISVHNNLETSKQIINDTISKKGKVQSKKDTVRVDSTYLVKEVVKPKDTLYLFNQGFDPINFQYWLKNYFPKINVSCSEYLAYKLSNELKWSDTSLIKCLYCDSIAHKEKTEEKKALKPGNIYIVLTPATEIKPLYSSRKQTLPEIIPVTLQLNGDYDSSANSASFTMLDTNLVNEFNIYDTLISITRDQWVEAIAAGGKLEIKLPVKSSTIKDTLGNVQRGFIVLKDRPASIYGYHEVQLASYGVYNPNKPFWMEVGSNFDFNDGLQPNNFFGGVFLHKRDIRPLFSLRPKGKRLPNFGIFAGVYQSKSIAESSDTSVTTAYYTNESLSLVDNNGNPGVFRDTGILKNKQVVKNIGLFFSPQLRLTNGTANAEGFHVSASVWLELQWQVITGERDVSSLKRRDTIHVPASQLTLYEPAALKKEIDLRSHYFGAGLPMFYKEGETNVFFNPVLGFSNQPASGIVRDNLKLGPTVSLNRTWNWFYVFQWRLNEEHFGISFTGEVRGLIQKNSKPIVSIALSKKFDLSHFLEFK